MDVLSLEGLEVHYGSQVAVHGVSFNIRPGEVLGLLGQNGAGKTSMLAAIEGLVRPAGGRVPYPCVVPCKDSPSQRTAASTTSARPARSPSGVGSASTSGRTPTRWNCPPSGRRTAWPLNRAAIPPGSATDVMSPLQPLVGLPTKVPPATCKRSAVCSA